MATITLATGSPASTGSPGSSLASGSFTPAGNGTELVIVDVVALGSFAAAPTLTSSVGGETYKLMLAKLSGGGSHCLYRFRAEQPATNVAQTATFNTSDPFTDAAIYAAIVDGMSRFDDSSFLQNATDDGASGEIPDPTYGVAADTNNCNLVSVGWNNNTGLTQPAGWTEIVDAATGGAGRRLEAAAIDNGFTGTQILYISAPNGVWMSIATEFDVSAPPSGAPTRWLWNT